MALSLRTKTAGLTHHWSYISPKPGVKKDRVVEVVSVIQLDLGRLRNDIAERKKDKSWTSIPDGYMRRFLEDLVRELDELIGALEGGGLEREASWAEKMKLSMEKANKTLHTYYGRSMGRYKGDPAVAERARDNWYSFAEKTLVAIFKYQKMIEKIPTITDEDLGIPDGLWARIMKEAAEIMTAVIKYGKIPLAGPLGKGKPKITKDEIAFNGKDPDDYESFILTRIPGEGFQFCKTADRPYDVAVTNILKAAQRIAPQYLDVYFEGPVKPLPGPRMVDEIKSWGRPDPVDAIKNRLIE